MAALEEQFDALLLGIASRTSGIDDLLDVFLGFMRRKSDAFNPPGGYPQLETAFVAALKRQYGLAEAERARLCFAHASAMEAAVRAATCWDDGRWLLDLEPDVSLEMGTGARLVLL